MVSRLSAEEKAYILENLFNLAEGRDSVVSASFAGDTLELIWRDCVMMEKKNKHNKEFVGGVLTSVEASSVVNASYDETTTHTEGKGKEYKRKEKEYFSEEEIKLEFKNKTAHEVIRTLYQLGHKIEKTKLSEFRSHLTEKWKRSEERGQANEAFWKDRLMAMRDYYYPNGKKKCEVFWSCFNTFFFSK